VKVSAPNMTILESVVEQTKIIAGDKKLSSHLEERMREYLGMPTEKQNVIDAISACLGRGEIPSWKNVNTQMKIGKYKFSRIMKQNKINLQLEAEKLKKQ